MTKKEYISPEMMVIELDSKVELMQSSKGGNNEGNNNTIGGPLGLAPFEESYNGELN